MSSATVDDRAFERLYTRHVRDVYRFALALLRNPAEAEDVTQTTFLNAYRALKAGDRPQKPHSWLLTIAHNAARSRVRQAMRRPREVPLDDVVNQLAVAEHERTNVRELLRALGRLPFNQRAAITMRELEGRSYDEIAETLGVTEPAVEALLARARRTLRLQAAAIRGLAVVGLPRSLRRFFENGETAAGGALGAGVIAKAAALVMAGVVAGGLGLASGGPPQPTPAATPRVHGVDAVLVVRPRVAPRRPAAAPAQARPARVVRAAPVASRPPSRVRAVPSAAADAVAPPPGPAAPATASAQAAAPAPAAATVASRPVRAAVQSRTVASTVKAATATVPAASALPAVPPVPVEPPPVAVEIRPVQTGPVQTGPVQVPPVSVPTLPPPPVSLPAPLPAPVSPPPLPPPPGLP